MVSYFFLFLRFYCFFHFFLHMVLYFFLFFRLCDIFFFFLSLLQHMVLYFFLLLCSPFMLLPCVFLFFFMLSPLFPPSAFISPMSPQVVSIIFLSQSTVYIFLIFPYRSPFVSFSSSNVFLFWLVLPWCLFFLSFFSINFHLLTSSWLAFNCMSLSYHVSPSTPEKTQVVPFLSPGASGRNIRFCPLGLCIQNLWTSSFLWSF